jgi:hypothetical protein
MTCKWLKESLIENSGLLSAQTALGFTANPHVQADASERTVPAVAKLHASKSRKNFKPTPHSVDL